MQYPDCASESEYVGHMAPCTCLALSKSEALLATGGMDALVTVWDTSCMAAVQTFYGPDSPVASLSFSPDNRWLAFNGNTSQGKTTIEVASLDRSQPVHRCALAALDVWGTADSLRLVLGVRSLQRPCCCSC